MQKEKLEKIQKFSILWEGLIDLRTVSTITNSKLRHERTTSISKIYQQKNIKWQDLTHFLIVQYLHIFMEKYTNAKSLKPF